MADNFNIDQLAEMSDEDFMSSAENYDYSDVTESEETDTDTEGTTEDEVTDEVTDLDDSEETEELEDETEEDEVESEDEDITEDEEDAESEEDDLEDDAEESETDTNAELEKLFSPFAANGTQIKVDSVDEAIELMKMGANYHKKMHTLKPHLRFLKTLEKNELLNEDKINFMIDLYNGDKKAIAKLMSEGKIDPLDINTEESNEYSPVKHTVSEASVNLDEVFERIQHTPTFKDTMDVITTQWDSSSKEKLVSNPQRIEVLNAHKASGLFDRINAEVNKQRMLGQILNTVSDIDAYEQVGIQLMQAQQPTSAKKPVDVKAKKPTNPKAKSDKKRLAAPKAKKTTDRTGSIESLAQLSDEDFLKVSSKYF